MRNTGLDLLRLLAVMLVLGRHIDPAADSGALLNGWHRGGWVGVDLFFVLSGYLVSGLLFKEYGQRRNLDVVRFLIRRGFKIYPAFWCLLLFTLLMAWRWQQPVYRRELLGECLFLQNYLGGLWGHTWSLAVEEHFYFGLALAFFGMIRLHPHDAFRGLPRLFLGVVLACTVLRWVNVWIHPVYAHHTHLYPTHLRLDSLFFGVWLAYLRHKSGHLPLPTVPGVVLVGGGIALLSPAFIWSVEHNVWISVVGVMLFYLGSGGILLAAARIERCANPCVKAMAALGARSYSIYLWHLPVKDWVVPFLDSLGRQSVWGHIPNGVLFVVGSLALGALMSSLVEWPTLWIRDRLFPSGIRGVAAPSPRLKGSDPAPCGLGERDTGASAIKS